MVERGERRGRRVNHGEGSLGQHVKPAARRTFAQPMEEEGTEITRLEVVAGTAEASCSECVTDSTAKSCTAPPPKLVFVKRQVLVSPAA